MALPWPHANETMPLFVFVPFLPPCVHPILLRKTWVQVLEKTPATCAHRTVFEHLLHATPFRQARAVWWEVAEC